MVTPTKQGVTDSAVGGLIVITAIGLVKAAPKAFSWISSKAFGKKDEEAKAA